MTRQAIQVIDLGFGDSGKGSIVDYLAWRYEANWVVRFNGGPQAGHNVVLPDGRHHTFSQFSSATFQPGVRTLLSRFMLIDPYAMRNEATHLEELGVPDAMARTFIDARCPVITPPQQVANRLRERARGAAAHGTCGMGIGECVADAIEDKAAVLRAADLTNPALVRTKLSASLLRKRAQMNDLMYLATPSERHLFEDDSWIDRACALATDVASRANIISADQAAQILINSSLTIFEGAQGVLLDEYFGFHPHTTWSITTYANADQLLDETGVEFIRTRIGVLRPYLTRHGNGPLVTEDAQISDRLREPHNRYDGYAGRFRYGVLDLVMLRYALNACGGVHALAVTCLDHLPHLPPLVCDHYTLRGDPFWPIAQETLEAMEQVTQAMKQAVAHFSDWPTHSAQAWIAAMEAEIGLRIGLRSYGVTRERKSVAGG